MKKLTSILACSSMLILSGGVNMLTSCSSNNTRHYQETPKVRTKRLMNPNVPNITVGDFRLQILDKSTVRFEYKYQNPKTGETGWLDDDTLFVPERTLFPGVDSKDYQVNRSGNYTVVTMGDIEIKIPNNIDKDLKGILVSIDGKQEYDSTNAATDNKGDLKSPSETPQVFEMVDTPRIIEPVYGYSPWNMSDPYYSKYFSATDGFDIQTDARDIYLTFPRKDAKALRQQYRNLAGAPEMVRLSTLGAWDSRYYPYNEQTAQDEVDHYYQNNLPLDNLVIDTDWRAGFDGKGYFVNETLFPNMPRFLKSMHNQNIEVCFNDHPEPQKNSLGEELDVLNVDEVDFRNNNLRKILGMGLDTWWYDRNWSTSLICPEGTDEQDLNHEVWGDYLYNNVTKQYYMMNASAKYGPYGNFVYKRPTAMSNVIQVRNGNWEGFTDTMAHRYSIQWTGDQNWRMLPSEIENVVKTGLNSMPYMSSDLAGHTNGVASDYYYQRWMEYGALSPIFRIHCTRDLEKHCQPWYRSEEVINTFRNWINLRYRLLPLYYSLAKQAYDTGLPICRAIGLVDPTAPDRLDEYCIGDNILFAPCDVPAIRTTPNDKWVTWIKGDGSWTDNIKVELYKTGKLEEVGQEDYHDGDPIYVNDISESLKSMDTFFREHFSDGKSDNRSAIITAKFKLSNDDYNGYIPTLSIDDGFKATITKKNGDEDVTVADCVDWRGHATEDIQLTKGGEPVKLEKGIEYTMTLYYFNESGGGNLDFRGSYDTGVEQAGKETGKKVYFPAGKWMNVFTGKVYEGGSEQTIEDVPTSQNALFVKLGTMLPLIKEARNTKSLDWTNLSYDVYPSIDAPAYSSSLYEDDTETVAYQNGYYHTSRYGCYYDAKKGDYVIKLDPSIGWFIGDDIIANRAFNIRLHQIEGLQFGKVTVDGAEIEVEPTGEDENIAMPFNFDGASRTEPVWIINIPSDSVRKAHEIRIHVTK